MRSRWRYGILALLWALALWPLLLQVLHGVSPALAVAWDLRLRQGAVTAAMAGLTLAAAALLLHPPVLPALRLRLRSLGQSLRTDRSALLRAQGELRSLETAARQLEVGRLALRSGDARTALPHLERAVELDPEHLPGRYQLALALLRAGRPADAAAQFEQVLARDPGHAFGDARLRLGEALMALGSDQQALVELRAFGREHGPTRQSQFWIAQLCRALGDPAGEREALAAAGAPPARGERIDLEQAWFRARAVARLRWSRGR